MVQPFLTATSLDLSATICVAFSVAIPLLAALVLVNGRRPFVAGVAMLASGLVAVAVHRAGYVHLERDQGTGDTGS